MPTSTTSLDPSTPSATDAAPAPSKLSIAMFSAVHLTALSALFVPLTPRLVALAAASYVVRMWGVSLGYHRYFSHRSFKTSRVFQFILAWVGACAVQNGPIWWASWHRVHHKLSDTPQDIHSPIQRGFWHAQAGWYFDGTKMKADFSNVKDLTKYPELMWIERNGWMPALSFLLLCYALAGFAGVVWVFLIPTLLVLHCVGMVNSVGHMIGSRPYDTGDTSRNNVMLALLTFGDGWHNNHHHHQLSARHGFRWWEFDPNYYCLRVLALLGIVWDVRVPSPAVLEDTRAARAAAQPPTKS